jgi:hypothetical protein
MAILALVKKAAIVAIPNGLQNPSNYPHHLLQSSSLPSLNLASKQGEI